MAADARNLVIWLVGFIAYRLLMGVDTPVGLHPARYAADRGNLRYCREGQADEGVNP